MRFTALGSALALCALAVVAALTLGGWGFVVVAGLLGAVALIGIHDVVQRRHSILRNYPILGHARFALEAVRPELQQYFIERNTDGRPCAVVAEALRLIGSMGLHSPAEVGPHHLVRRVDHVTSSSYAELYEWLAPGQLIEEPPESCARDWERADPDTFAARAPEPSVI